VKKTKFQVRVEAELLQRLDHAARSAGITKTELLLNSVLPAIEAIERAPREPEIIPSYCTHPRLIRHDNQPTSCPDCNRLVR
jgi:hypothetical protein